MTFIWRCNFIDYCTAYFTSRTFSIKLGSFLSRVYNVVRGCPQGGILSPLLFAIYYNDVGSALLGAKYKLFADDLVFYVFGENVSSLIDKVNSILLSLNNWCETMLLSINFGKTEFMIFHKVQNKISEQIAEVLCDGHTIKQVTHFKYLGVIFDEHFTFEKHFEHVSSRVSGAVGCILQMKRLVNVRMFKILINSFVFSIIDYCFPVWGKISQT